MIPITVSFFLNQRGGILQALVFSLGIVVLFCALGLGVTAAVGPFGVNQLGANPWVNGFITLVFGAFALSLLGAFEITLPSSMLTKLDSASRRGGYLGTLLMGLTFALTSFACIGPFMGSLLVASVQSKGLQPVLGMVALRRRPGVAILLPGRVPRLPEETAEKRRLAGARQGRHGIRPAGRHAQVRLEHRPSSATRLDHARAFPGRLVRPVRTGRPVPARPAQAGRKRRRRSPGHRTPDGRQRLIDLRVQPAARHVRRPARRTGRLRSSRVASGGLLNNRASDAASLDEEPVSARRSIRPAPKTSWCW